MVVVNDRCIEQICQREAVDALLIQVIDLGASVDHVGAIYHQHQYKIDTIAVYSFRSWLSFSGQFCVNAELVRFDMPVSIRRQPAENATAKSKDRCHSRPTQDLWLDRLVVARNAAVEIVVA